MQALIVGSSGFIGKNLKKKLEQENINFFEVTKKTNKKKLEDYCKKVDVIFHVAGQNKSILESDFKKNNVLITKKILDILTKNNLKTKIIYLSTIKYNEKNYYGKTKKEAEKVLLTFSKKNSSIVNILRLPNVFGKWCKPNYNSFVTTMFYNIPRNINFIKLDLMKKIKLIHIDDVTSLMFELAFKKSNALITNVKPEKILSINKLYNLIKKMWLCHKDGYLYNFKSNFERKLYSTFLTYLPSKKITREIKMYQDKRGFFSELLKNKTTGQISVFSINPWKTRGQHYHNIKILEVLILNGKVIFKTKNLISNKTLSKEINSKKITEIISVPGTVHEIKNIGESIAIVLLWSDEIYDKNNPDTFFNTI